MGEKKATPIYKRNGLEIKLGNFKIGYDTLIFNMGTAEECPSRRLGLCQLGNACYALRDERRYWRHIPKYRKRQEKYWKSHTSKAFFNDLSYILENKKRAGKKLRDTVKYIRFNESGDLWGQKDVEKLSDITTLLWEAYGIKVYTYTARNDLDLSKAKFRVHTSGWKHEGHGMSVASSEPVKTWRQKKRETGEVWTICPMDCSKCPICKETDKNLVFPLH